ncbi:MAG: vancomycin resistance protein, partial [Syntrophomonadaceae bacterium]|nr:vancomycin resistance protein [Syntrophomonadaceae bacterium]
VFPDVNRTQPFGSGATVVYNYVDLQITNHTDTDYQLVLWLDEGFLHGEWRSQQAPLYTYEVYEKQHLITQEWWGGYIRHNQLNRRIYDLNGQEIEDAAISENHAVMMYSPMLASEIGRS